MRNYRLYKPDKDRLPNMEPDRRKSWMFVFLIGVVSLFADMTHEGARSITGPFLATLGASATVVGFVAGLGELVGYAIRFVSGLISDRTRKYWTVTFAGYIINLFAVPLLALSGSWPVAAVLMVMERTGRGIRNPSRDTMLSHATAVVGHGKGFGFHEALDQIGAVLGPLIVSAVYLISGSYHTSFEILFVPALAAFFVLVIARRKYPNTEDLRSKTQVTTFPNYKKAFKLYLIALSLVALGFADFPLIAYHFMKSHQVPIHAIPLMYVVAMSFDGISAVIIGKYFDGRGLHALILSILISTFFAPLVFYGNIYSAICGMVFWGVGMGVQESVVRAVLATILPTAKRATGMGLFYANFGVFWFLGSFFLGWLYDASKFWLVIFSIGVQIAALPFIIQLSKRFSF